MKKTLLAALVAASVLAACGGGGDSSMPPAPTSQVPDVASQSVAGFIAYLKALVAAPADMLEPVNTSTVTPPSDDAAEPQKVD